MEKEELFSLIEKGSNPKGEALARLREYDGIIGIYGAGNYAAQLTRVFQHFNILVHGYIVDDAYICKDNQMLNGERVWSVSQFHELPFNKKTVIHGYQVKYKELAENIDILYEKFKGCDLLTCFDATWLLDYEILSLDYAFFNDNYSLFNETYHLFNDDLSREIMVAYLNGRISGKSNQIADYQKDGIFNYQLDLLLSNVKGGGVIIDCGAFDGTTAIAIHDFLDGQNPDDNYIICCFECDEENYRNCIKACSDIPNITFENKGVFDRNGSINVSGTGDSVLLGSNPYDIHGAIDVIKIDDFVENNFMTSPIKAIVMDIEGSELQALMGGV